MAKYEIINEPVFVNRVEEITSKYGNEIFQVEFIGIKTQKIYKTYLDPLNVNFMNWEQLIKLSKLNGIVVPSGLKLKDSEKQIINADSRIETINVVTKEELSEIVSAYWKSQDSFQRLFGEEI